MSETLKDSMFETSGLPQEAPTVALDSHSLETAPYEQQQEEAPDLGQQAFEELSARERHIVGRERELNERLEDLNEDDEQYQSYLEAVEAQEEEGYYPQEEEYYEDGEYEEGGEEEFVSAEDFEDHMLDRVDERMQEREVETQEESLDAEAEDDFRGEIHDFANEYQEAFPYVAAFPENQEEVYNLVEDHYNNTGQLLPLEDAASMIEDYVDQQIEQYLQLPMMADKLSEYGFRKNDILPHNVLREGQVTAPRSMNNNFNQAAPTMGGKLLSREESLARAARHLTR